MMNKRVMQENLQTNLRITLRTTLLAGLSVLLYACGSTSKPDSPGTGGGTDQPGSPGTGGGGPSIAWGPQLDASDLSPVHGADDDFGPDVAGALMQAARTAPNGASQTSRDVDEDGRADDEMSVHVVRDDDERLVHEVTDGAQIAVRVPGPEGLPRQEGRPRPVHRPDSGHRAGPVEDYPHEVLGMWAWEGGVDGALEVWVFWSASPSIPPVEFGDGSPTGTATYEGDAVGLHAAGGAVSKFLADVDMSADFGSHMVRGKVSGKVSGFRSLAGSALGADLVVNLGETEFLPQGEPFAGGTTASGVPGSGAWGARWSDDKGWAMGGTFGFAADDESVGVLGAFTAAQPGSTDGGDPNNPVASNP